MLAEEVLTWPLLSK